jgi:hypothetical protein
MSELKTKSLHVSTDITWIEFPTGSVWLTDAPESVVEKTVGFLANVNSPDKLSEYNAREELKDLGYFVYKCANDSPHSTKETLSNRTGLNFRDIFVKLNTLRITS